MGVLRDRIMATGGGRNGDDDNEGDGDAGVRVRMMTNPYMCSV